jgi:hypothetical protein
MALAKWLAFSYSPMFSQPVSSISCSYLSELKPYIVPLATLLNATKPPVPKAKPGTILTEQGYMRYFVVHGGLFSKDGVTLEDIRKINRIGKQPGQEGLMSTLVLILLIIVLIFSSRRRGNLWLYYISIKLKEYIVAMDRPSSNAWPRSKQAGKCLVTLRQKTTS